MQDDRPRLRSEALPHRLSEAFRALRTGKHVCVEDGTLYRVIEQDEDRYKVILSGLGYQLVHHPQGFYYLSGGRTLSTRGLQAISLFIFILFQDLEEKKTQDPERSWVRSLLNRTFAVEQLPHFETPQRRAMMADIGVTRATLRRRVLRLLQALGMLTFVEEGRFRFKSPIYRFVDLCTEYGEGDWATDGDGESSRPGESAVLGDVADKQGRDTQ